MLSYWSDVTWYSRHRSAHPLNRRIAALQLLGGRGLLLGSAGLPLGCPNAAVSGIQLTRPRQARSTADRTGLSAARSPRSRFAREVVAALKLPVRRPANPSPT